MNLKIKNFGIISEADIKLDGITVICGNNDSGKSTVGKALFGFFNSLNDLESKVINIKEDRIASFLLSLGHGFSVDGYMDIKTFLNMNSNMTVEILKDYLDNHVLFLDNNIKITKEKLKSVADTLNVSKEDIINESVWRFFNSVMNNQIKNVNSANSKCSIESTFKNSKSSVTFYKEKCECKLGDTIIHKAYYISNPNVVDYIGANYRFYGRILNLMERSTIKAISEAQSDIDDNPMIDILDAIINKDDLNEIKMVLNRALDGNINITKGKYIYCSTKGDFDIRNLSVGLKLFVLIERMLETGVLKHKDVLILDEPEIHLHSQWQLIYAELIVMLQKKFNLTILIVTHSFHFLESLEFYMKRYEIINKSNFYVPYDADNGVKIQSYGNDPSELKLNLSTGDFNLANMQLEYELKISDKLPESQYGNDYEK